MWLDEAFCNPVDNGGEFLQTRKADSKTIKMSCCLFQDGRDPMYSTCHQVAGWPLKEIVLDTI